MPLETWVTWPLVKKQLSMSGLIMNVVWRSATRHRHSGCLMELMAGDCLPDMTRHVTLSVTAWVPKGMSLGVT